MVFDRDQMSSVAGSPPVDAVSETARAGAKRPASCPVSHAAAQGSAEKQRAGIVSEPGLETHTPEKPRSSW